MRDAGRGPGRCDAISGYVSAKATATAVPTLSASGWSIPQARAVPEHEDEAGVREKLTRQPCTILAGPMSRVCGKNSNLFFHCLSTSDVLIPSYPLV